jgi:hypothetical protein
MSTIYQALSLKKYPTLIPKMLIIRGGEANKTWTSFVFCAEMEVDTEHQGSTLTCPYYLRGEGRNGSSGKVSAEHTFEQSSSTALTLLFSLFHSFLHMKTLQVLDQD